MTEETPIISLRAQKQGLCGSSCTLIAYVNAAATRLIGLGRDERIAALRDEDGVVLERRSPLAVGGASPRIARKGEPALILQGTMLTRLGCEVGSRFLVVPLPCGDRFRLKVAAQ